MNRRKLITTSPLLFSLGLPKMVEPDLSKGKEYAVKSMLGHLTREYDPSADSWYQFHSGFKNVVALRWRKITGPAKFHSEYGFRVHPAKVMSTKVYLESSAKIEAQLKEIAKHPNFLCWNTRDDFCNDIIQL